MVLLVSSVVAIATAAATRTETFHRLCLRNNPAPGIVRLGVILSMGWIGFVLWRYADPSVTGIYVVFYLVMGYAVVKLFGQLTATLYGARTRVDAIERRNVPAALVIAAFTLATGLIFGGSLWEEADPVGDGEGGWWIPAAFFLLGWTTLVIAHEVFAGVQARAHRRGTAGDVGGGQGPGPSDARRTIEAVVYLLIGLAAWGMHRLLDLSVGAG